MTGDFLLRKTVYDTAQLNSAVHILFYVGDDSDQQLRIKTDLLGAIASEPAFDTLRTKEQLGYIVSASPRASLGLIGFQILVQSERDPEYIDARVEAWLVSFKKFLEDMTEEEFAKHRQSLINKKKEDFKNMGQE